MSKFVLKTRDVLNATHVSPARLSQYRNGYRSPTGDYEYPPLLQKDKDWTWVGGRIFYTMETLKIIHAYRDSLKYV